MPLRLDSIIKKKLQESSARVKCVDLHETETWVVSGLYSGHLHVYNWDNAKLLKTFEACELPIRCCKFVCSKHWILCGSDDFLIRAFNYNTSAKVAEFEAHTDYIRYIEVHPSLPCFLSSSDDMQIKLWEIESNGGIDNTQIFDGHVHYVMMCKFNPKDSNYFASASLDKTIKVWCLGASEPNFSLEGHEQGVNCVSYYTGGDRPLLVSGSDDNTVRIWDYQTKSCLQKLEGHDTNVAACIFHPKIPVIVSASEDGSVRMWNNSTFRCEATLNYGMNRAWSLAANDMSHALAVGFDDGTVVLKVGTDKPVMSMDKSGKTVWCLSNDVVTATVKGVEAADGEVVPLTQRDLGRADMYPTSVSHNLNGRFIAMVGDGEYIVSTSMRLRSKCYGQCQEFVWSSSSNSDFALRLQNSTISTFKNFKEHKSIKTGTHVKHLFGGSLLGVGDDKCVRFYDWDSCILIRQIDVAPKAVFWSESGEYVALCCDDAFYILECARDGINSALREGTHDEDGVDDSFALKHSFGDRVRTGVWVGDCFLFMTKQRINYYVGGEIKEFVHVDRPMYILGYLQNENRIYCVDKSKSIISYKLLFSVLSYQTAVVRKDIKLANKILKEQIPKSEYDTIARFLNSQGYKKQALLVATDPDLKFELAIDVGLLQEAYEIVQSYPDHSTTEVQHKWKQLGDLALSSSNLKLAQDCAQYSDDLAGQLVIHTSLGSAENLEELGKSAKAKGRFNVAFLCYFLLGKIEKCLEILNDAGRVPEAAFLARTYMPSKVSEMVALWRKDLEKVSKRAAESLADPSNYANLFPNLAHALKAEQLIARRREQGLLKASVYSKAKLELDLNLVEEISKLEAQTSTQTDVQTESDAGETNEIDQSVAAEVPAVAENASTEEPVAGDDSVVQEESTPPTPPADENGTEQIASEVIDAESEDIEDPAATDTVDEDDEEFLAEFEGIDDNAIVDEGDLEDFEKEIEGMDDD